MNALAVVLESAAILAAVSFAASLALAPLLRWIRGGQGIAARRADVAFLLGVLPALLALFALIAALAPSVLAVLRGQPDHCPTHSHHLHLCIVHAAGLRAPLAAVGAASLAFFAYGAIRRASAWHAQAGRVAQLRALAATDPAHPAVAQVPGPAWLCFTAGLLRPRVFISRALGEHLTPDELRAAIAHEESHARRRDPLLQGLLAAAGILTPPFFSRRAAELFASAAEEASDSAAARAVGDGATVASALVKVAALLPARPAPFGMAFGEHALERRVLRLLDSTPADRRSLALAVGLLAALSLAALAASHTDAVHHAVETLLHHLS